MTLDRTWYNTLVDDDGSGMTGSVWDKADVDSLMDAIDAEFAKTPTWPPTWAGWDPQWFTSNSEVTVPAQNSCRYYRIGNILHVNIFATGLFFAAAADALQFFLPPNAVILTPTIEQYTVLLAIGSPATTHELGYGTAKDAYVGEIRRANNTQFPQYAHVNIHGQGFYFL